MKAVLAAPPPAFFGVWVVRATFLLAIFGWGVGFYGPPIYLAEVIRRTGWPLGLVSAAMTVHFLVGAVVVANLPRLYARFGLPAVTAAGAMLTAFGLVGWAIAQAPWQLFCAALLTGMGWVAMGAVAVNTLVATWYQKHRPMALSKAYNGASIGGVIFSPLWVALIAWLGFANAASMVGAVLIVVVLLLTRHVFSKTPESCGQTVDDETPASTNIRTLRPNQQPASSGIVLWRHRAFITLSAGMAFGLFAQIGLLAHLFNLLAPAVGAQRMGWLMGMATACAIGGRMLAARAVRHFENRRAVAAGSYLVQALGVAALLLSGGENLWLITLGMVLFGTGIGNATSLPPLVAQSDFPPPDVARAVALIVAIGQATYAFAPAFFGLLQGSSVGPHDRFFLLAIGIQLLAAAAFLVHRPRTR